MTMVGSWLDPTLTTQTLEPVAKPFPPYRWAGTVAAVVNWTGFGILFASVPAAAVCVVLRFRLPGGRAPAAALGRVRGGRLGGRAGGGHRAGGHVSPAQRGRLLLPAVAVGAPGHRRGRAPATGCGTWTARSAAPSPTPCSPCCWASATPPSLGLGRLPSRARPWSWPPPPWPWRWCSPPAPPGPGAGRPVLQPAPLRRRPDPEGFSAWLRDQVDLDALNSELLAVVDQTMQPT